MSQPERLAQLASDPFTRGLFYAIANYRIYSPVPFEPVENWRFWTQPRPSVAKWFARAYPPEPIRKAYLDSMLAHDQ